MAEHLLSVVFFFSFLTLEALYFGGSKFILTPAWEIPLGAYSDEYHSETREASQYPQGPSCYRICCCGTFKMSLFFGLFCEFPDEGKSLEFGLEVPLILTFWCLNLSRLFTC